jgi:uncharacterized membrane protein
MAAGDPNPESAASAASSAREFEDYPLTRPEYISAMVHLYRGELNRANTWRIRLDTSTNWAILAVMGILSFAFGSAEQSHATILVGMLLVFHFLTLEARRYRLFDVWRHRLRMIEENFYGPLLTRDLKSPEAAWGTLVAGDLLDPCFKITYLQAFRNRFLRNYATIFAVLLVAWAAKVAIHEQIPGATGLDRCGIGPIPGWVAALLVAAIYLFLVAVVLFVPSVAAPEAAFWKERKAHRGRPDF